MIKKLMVGILGVLLSSSIAFAMPINGSTTVSAVSADLFGGTNLGTATAITPTGGVIHSGLGDYAAISNYTPTTNETLDLSNILDYTWTSENVGTWTTSAYTIVTQTASFLDLFLIGTFTPDVDGVLAAFDPSGASEHLSLTQSGNSVSWSATLNSPALSTPAPVPEPGTIMLLSSGLFALIVYGKRRKNQINSCTA
ncbi:MAG: PEP-CTERM sorting domain-containing protein [Desulfuromonadaceae bacterium]|nr:PEP-CTERM sorting domain-containing protein [Desulfuromonadaceae bacterium]MDD5107009.1 PEP-CTERM sorting domain-containing protein [Desulfuromonadaceae bacterium]